MAAISLRVRAGGLFECRKSFKSDELARRERRRPETARAVEGMKGVETKRLLDGATEELFDGVLCM